MTRTVFLHGMPLDRTVWGPQLEAFPGALAPDLPGFGSRQLDGEADLGELAPIIAGAHLVGHSFGAAVAIDLALRRSGSVRSLTLANPLLLGRSSNIAAWSTCVERAKAGNIEGARAAWLDVRCSTVRATRFERSFPTTGEVTGMGARGLPSA